MSSAVVFAYHDVGVRCLSVLLAQGVEVRHVYTHADDPNENIWFGSVAELARLHGIPVTLVDRQHLPGLRESVAAQQADFLFSFYFRFMLAPEILASVNRGAFNMHGSLLPRYRGRVPVNWAIIHGEHETGATLHEMVAKPDAGRIVDQQAIPILPNDIAVDVFRKVTVAAEMVLQRALGPLLTGSATLKPQNLASGSYFGGRKPEDGRIDWRWSAQQIHNLVRAVAPPYPGAFATLGDRQLRVLQTFYTPQTPAVAGPPSLKSHNEQLHLQCADGVTLRVLSAEIDGQALTAKNMNALIGSNAFRLTN
jgi:methionyl-tRNA formyltransferase